MNKGNLDKRTASNLLKINSEKISYKRLIFIIKNLYFRKGADEV